MWWFLLALLSATNMCRFTVQALLRPATRAIGTCVGPSAPLGRCTTRRYLTTQILVVGKKNSVEDWIEDGCSEFTKRLTPVMDLSTTFVKSDEALVEAVQQSRGLTICLDENGKAMTSREFSKYLYKSFELGGAHVNLVIGGFAGLPPELRGGKYPLISLSKMTWTHQMARLLLIEQIYRASEIHKGSGYHKD